jgi:hydrogenase maturation factor
VSDDCGSDHCVTCSDEGVEMYVLESGENGLAVCADAAGSRNEVMTDLVGPVARGDSVLVHAGVAIARVG